MHFVFAWRGVESERHMMLTRREDWDDGKEGERGKAVSAAAKAASLPPSLLHFACRPRQAQATSKHTCTADKQESA